MGAGARHGRSWVAAGVGPAGRATGVGGAPAVGQRTSVRLDGVIGWLRSPPEPVEVTFEARPTGLVRTGPIAAGGGDRVPGRPRPGRHRQGRSGPGAHGA